MTFFYFLVILLIFLLIITLLSSAIKFSLLLTTRHKYDTSVLIVPSMLNLIAWSLILWLWSLTINRTTGSNIFELAFNNILNISSIRDTIASVLPSTILFIVFGIVLQSFSFFAVNIPYTKIKNRCKLTFNKIFHIKLKINNEVKELVINPEEKELNMGTSFIASVFTFSLTFFALAICFAIGNIISSKILLYLMTK